MIAVQIDIGCVIENGQRITIRHPHELLAKPEHMQEVGMLAGWHPDQIPVAVAEVDWPEFTGDTSELYVLNIPILMN
ncbi:hypothetical protein [Arsenicibacter rosenii]|uniref:Uncharacterized protein n=1 Tax=Arsenicibacter rosenii TaxID=1750698 RepID=A0A1S2VAU6_9BACT|nr:hypothetical protein [Arsenicibacter rosenii]OIN55867.1 hypothetical protein BLX24_27825 [Arsenicibacter rosenii]